MIRIYPRAVRVPIWIFSGKRQTIKQFTSTDTESHHKETILSNNKISGSKRRKINHCQTSKQWDKERLKTIRKDLIWTTNTFPIFNKMPQTGSHKTPIEIASHIKRLNIDMQTSFVLSAEKSRSIDIALFILSFAVDQRFNTIFIVLYRFQRFY